MFWKKEENLKKFTTKEIIEGFKEIIEQHSTRLNLDEYYLISNVRYNEFNRKIITSIFIEYRCPISGDTDCVEVDKDFNLDDLIKEFEIKKLKGADKKDIIREFMNDYLFTIDTEELIRSEINLHIAEYQEKINTYYENT